MAHVYIKTQKELDLIEPILRKYIEESKAPLIAVDLETRKTTEHFFPKAIKRPDGTYEGYPTLIALGLDPEIVDAQIVIDARYFAPTVLGGFLKPFLEHPKVTILGQNYKYDFGFLYTQYGIYTKKHRDTHLLAKYLKAGLGFEGAKLSDLYKKFLDYGWFHGETGMSFSQYEEFKSSMQISDWSLETVLTEDQIRYSADDVRLIFYLYKAIKDQVKYEVKLYKKKSMIDCIELECDLIPAFCFIELAGFDVDVNYQSQVVIPFLEDKYKEALKRLEEHFTVGREVTVVKGGRGRKSVKEVIRKVINPNSPKEVKDAIKAAGIDIPDTKKNTLKAHNSHPGIAALIDARRASKTNSTFGTKILKKDVLHEDGRIHAGFNSIGTKTGRSSSSDPLNFMNIPSRGKLFGESTAKFIRSAYVAIDPYRLLVFDYSQIEPRYGAQLTNDPGLVGELSKKEGDLHGRTAQFLMDLDEYAPKGSYEREYIGKTANLALFYGMGAYKLSKFMYDETDGLVNWNVEEAQEMIARYDAAYPMTKEFKDRETYFVSRDLEPFPSLASFKNRRPIYVVHTPYGRMEKWGLTSNQEKLAREFPEALHKNYVAYHSETGKRTSNEYSKFINTTSREAYNFRIQGACADILKIAHLNIHNWMYESGYDPLEERIINTVHDELVIRVHKDHVDDVYPMAQKIMEDAGRLFIKRVPVIAVGHVVQSWGEAK